jgi:hypothetical protein
MKRHYWQFLIDSSGNAVEGAKINVFLAGTSNYAWVYTEEAGTPTTTEFTDILTDVNGMFDFWIENKISDLTYGYDSTQRFTITWAKAGLLSGGMPNIDIIYGGGGSAGGGNGEFVSGTINIAAGGYVEFELAPPLIRALVYYLKVEPSGLADLYDIEFYDSTYTELLYQATNLSFASDWIDRFPFYLIDDLEDGKVYGKIRNTDAVNSGSFVITMKYERFA